MTFLYPVFERAEAISLSDGRRGSVENAHKSDTGFKVMSNKPFDNSLYLLF